MTSTPLRRSDVKSFTVEMHVSPKMWNFVKYCRSMGDTVDVVITEPNSAYPIAELRITQSDQEDPCPSNEATFTT